MTFALRATDLHTNSVDTCAFYAFVNTRACKTCTVQSKSIGTAQSANRGHRHEPRSRGFNVTRDGQQQLADRVHVHVTGAYEKTNSALVFPGPTSLSSKSTYCSNSIVSRILGIAWQKQKKRDFPNADSLFFVWTMFASYSCVSEQFPSIARCHASWPCCMRRVTSARRRPFRA